MKSNDQSTEQQRKLEQFVTKVCKQQPLRTAPHGLQTRVLRELQRRATLPWWRQSFMHWPLLLQVLFIVSALLTAKGALLLSDWVSTNLFAPAAEITQSSALIQSASTTLSIGRQVSSHLVTMVPMSWIYCAALVIAALYLVLFGIGVTTYKTLYAAR